MAADAPAIAAAASVRPALDSIMQRYAEATGQRFDVDYGASGTLAQRLVEGYPFQIVLAADEASIRKLESQGLTEEDGVNYAAGRLVMFARENSPLNPDLGVEDLHRKLDAGEIDRFAIPDPETAPYGRAAKEVLEFVVLWSKFGKQLLIGPDSQVAIDMVEQGKAQGAIIPQSLALEASTKDSTVKFQLLPLEWHTPIRHRMALIKGAVEPARLFYEFLKGPEAREVWDQWGLSLRDQVTLGDKHAE